MHETDCRWEETTKFTVTDEGGQKRYADVVYLDSELGIVVGDYLMRTTESELANATHPPAGARRVLETKRIPKMRYNETLFYVLI
jgi:hypothetical protein